MGACWPINHHKKLEKLTIDERKQVSIVADAQKRAEAKLREVRYLHKSRRVAEAKAMYIQEYKPLLNRLNAEKATLAIIRQSKSVHEDVIMLKRQSATTRAARKDLEKSGITANRLAADVGRLTSDRDAISGQVADATDQLAGMHELNQETMAETAPGAPTIYDDEFAEAMRDFDTAERLSDDDPEGERGRERDHDHDHEHTGERDARESWDPLGPTLDANTTATGVDGGVRLAAVVTTTSSSTSTARAPALPIALAHREGVVQEDMSEYARRQVALMTA